MVRLNRIYVKKSPESKIKLVDLQKMMESKFKKNASEIRFTGTKREPCLKIVLKSSMTLQAANRIFNSLSIKGIEIKDFIWKGKENILFDIENLEVTIS